MHLRTYLSSLLLILFCTSCSFLHGQVLINEVMIAPGSDTTSVASQALYAFNQPSAGREWVELYNPHPCLPVDLGCFILASNTGIQTGNQGAYAIPEGTILPPLGFLVIGGPQAPNVDINLFQKIGDPGLCGSPEWSLNNNEGWIALYTPSGAVSDALFWTRAPGEELKLMQFEEFDRAPCRPASCPGSPLKKASAMSLGSEIEYAGQTPSRDASLQRSLDGGPVWEVTAGTTPGLCNNGLCAFPTLTTLDAMVQQENCGQANGAISISVSSGQAPFSYSWWHDPGLSGPVASGLSEGVYSLTVFNGFGCPKDTQIFVPGTFNIQLSATPVLPDCGSSNGSLSITIWTGTPPYIFNWAHNPGLNSPVATGLPAGYYALTVTDAAGCVYDTLFPLDHKTGPALSILSKQNVSCKGGTDGAINLTVPGSVLSLLWNTVPPQGGGSIAGLPAGNYTVQALDTLGCIATLTVPITEPIAIEASAQTLPDTCQAGKGSAQLSVSGGNSPYDIVWGPATGGQTGPSATGLTEGNYNAFITDANGCQSSLNLDIPGMNKLAILTDFVQPGCTGSADGSATVIVAGGGNGTYSYQWSPNVSQSNQATALVPGTYTVVVSDDLGSCEATETFVIGAPDQILLDKQITKAGCFDSTGMVVITPSGGIPPYSILWEGLPPSSGFSVSGIPPGIYYVNVSDAAGCSVREIVVVESTAGPVATLEIVQADDCGLSEGIAQALISGGEAPYQYFWFDPDGQSAPLATGLAVRGYSFVVIDAQGCLDQAFIQMPGNPKLEVESVNTTADYCELGNGSISVSMKGGTPPYQYQWGTSPVQTGPAASGLLGNTFYLMEVTDAIGCRFTEIFWIAAEDGFRLSVEATDESCYGAADGTAFAVVTGGEAPFSYAWNDVGTPGPQISGLSPGINEVVVTDSRACRRFGSAAVLPAAFLDADFAFEPDIQQPLALSEAFFSFEDRSFGANEILWDFGDSTFSTVRSPRHRYTETGSYFVSLIVENGEGCQDTIRYGPFVVIEDGSFFVPGAFSPNNDGINDLFEIKGTYAENVNVKIFDRWGREIFSGNSLNDPWDGIMPGGSGAPPGVYVYAVSAILPGGKLVEKSGTLTLLR